MRWGYVKANKEIDKDGNNIIWIGDANGSLEDNEINEIVNKARLHNFMGLKHDSYTPKTFIKGSKPIDWILGTCDAIEMRKNQMLKFNNLTMLKL